MNLKDPKIQRILIAGVLVILLGIGFEFGTLRGKRREIKKLKDTYAKVEDRVNKARAIAGRVKTLQAKLDSLNAEWEALQQKLPKEKEMPRLLSDLARAGTRTNAEFLLFQPLSKTIYEHYTQHPVKIEIDASYHQLGFFLTKIANMQRLVNISKLKLGPTKSKNRAKTLQASFIATAYTITKPGTYKPPEEEKKQRRSR